MCDRTNLAPLVVVQGGNERITNAMDTELDTPRRDAAKARIIDNVSYSVSPERASYGS